MLEDREAQDGNGLHLPAHFQQLIRSRRQVFFLLGDALLLAGELFLLAGKLLLLRGELLLLLREQGLLVLEQLVLGRKVFLLCRKRELHLVQIHRELLEVRLGIVHLLHGDDQSLFQVRQLLLAGGQLDPGLFQLTLGILEVVAGDHIRNIAQQHQEKQDQRHRRHHVGIGGPEALLSLSGAHHGVRAADILPSHCCLPPPMRRLISRKAEARSRTARSIRSTLPRRL